MQKIFFVEDDDGINFIIKKTLDNSNFKSEGFKKGLHFIEKFKEEKPSLVLLDLMLPDVSGFELIKYIRKTDQKIPIIVVSAFQDETQKVQAFDLGADDYIVKPFGILELTSRIKSKLRKVSVELTLSFEDLVMYPKKRIVQNKLKKINLTVKEFDILKYILINKENIVSKEEIYKSVWNSNVFVESRTLDVHVKSLRKKLIDCNVNFFIKTVRGIGYKIEKKIWKIKK